MATAAKTAAEKADRIEALEAAHAKGGKIASERQAEAASLALPLGEAVAAYFKAANEERDSRRQLGREGVEVSGSFRGLSAIEDAARALRGGERISVLVPVHQS
jgi:hypothetical protein